MGHIAPFTLRTLLYGDDNLDLTETLRFINDSKRFACLPRICYVSFLYKFFTCLGINKIRLNQWVFSITLAVEDSLRGD